MAIVTVQNKFQVIIPRSVREELGIHRGDLLEAKVERGKLTYTRKGAIEKIPSDRPARERFFKELRASAPEWLKETWAASKKAGLDKMTMREIDAEIAAVRKERAGRGSPKRPPR